MNVKLPVLLAFLVGVLLIGAGIKNKSPVDYLKLVLFKKGVATPAVTTDTSKDAPTVIVKPGDPNNITPDLNPHIAPDLNPNLSSYYRPGMQPSSQSLYLSV